MPTSTRLGRLVAATPGDRNRAVDVVRVLALGAVVLGHWLKQGWYVDVSGDLHRAGLLGIATWTHPVTWVFQVIPVFFVVGGFANAHSWQGARARGTSYGAWLSGRTERLTRPVVPLLTFWVLVVPVAPALGIDRNWLRIASLTSLLPVWFLATYVVIVATTPLGLAAWERWGARAPATGLGLAALVDLVSIESGTAWVGGLNLLLVWSTLAQVGFAWSDGWFARRRRAVGCSVAGLVATLLLVWLGPYGVSMVGVDGFGLNNTNPPRVTLVCLGLFLAGGAIAAEPLLAGAGSVGRVWTTVVAVEGRLMTIYLWHPTALAIVGSGAVWLGGLGLTTYPNTQDWWLARPLWLVLLAATTAVLVTAVGRWEDPTRRRAASETGPFLPLLEVMVASAGLGFLASEGMARGALSWGVAAGTAAALVVLDRLLCPPAPVGDELTRGRTAVRRGRTSTARSC